jgi:SAM-dependent methyltransferase
MNSAREIEYLSSPSSVRMADSWFDVASLDHFWIRRRFEVLQNLAGTTVSQAHELAEIGCGSGLLQRQIEICYGHKVTGIDLNEHALKRNFSQLSPVCCYDIYEQRPAFRGKFDVIFLFDVLEHVVDENRFLASVRHHLAANGALIVNVPAGQWAYSKYDQAAGHVRRYSVATLRDVVTRNSFYLAEWSWWGLPFLFPLLLRKLLLRRSVGESQIISKGFGSRTPAVNWLMRIIGNCEFIPQKLIGTSLMAVLRFKPGLQ